MAHGKEYSETKRTTIRILNMARPMGKRHQEDVRAKIQASQIINRLYAGFTGEVELTNEQVNIGKTLLNKVLPDLKAVEHSGDQEAPIGFHVTWAEPKQ